MFSLNIERQPLFRYAVQKNTHQHFKVTEIFNTDCGAFCNGLLVPSLYWFILSSLFAYLLPVIGKQGGNMGTLEKRTVILGEYIVEHGSTVRDAAKSFGISKSTVHKDVSQRLRRINPQLYGEVKRVLEHNKAQRHIRGGLATKEKYLRKAKWKRTDSVRNRSVPFVGYAFLNFTVSSLRLLFLGASSTWAADSATTYPAGGVTVSWYLP